MHVVMLAHFAWNYGTWGTTVEKLPSSSRSTNNSGTIPGCIARSTQFLKYFRSPSADFTALPARCVRACVRACAGKHFTNVSCQRTKWQPVSIITRFCRFIHEQNFAKCHCSTPARLLIVIYHFQSHSNC